MHRVFFIANNNIGNFGLSGGDRVFIELARAWKEKTELYIIGCEEAITICKREGLSEVTFLKTCGKLGVENVFSLSAIFRNFFKKIISGSIFILKNRKFIKTCSHVYSVSDFYPDSFPAFMVKLLNPRVKWIAGFYLFAPAPWARGTPYKGKDILRGILYWLSQKPIYWIINKYADMVFVTSEPDRIKFVTRKRGYSKVIAIRGGVDTSASTEYLNSSNVIPVAQRKYDACFQGRFHVQKGVLALIDIWRIVVQFKPNATLAMIGNGPLEAEVTRRLKEYALENNIFLFGFLDGEAKFDIFKQSRIIVHPATFDSGGMSAAEAMAWGLPGVSFDLDCLRTYYPRGMVKVPTFDYSKFAQAILRLLSDREYYEQIANAARGLIVSEWDWHKQADKIFNEVFNPI